jgi:hypothetical protein
MPQYDIHVSCTECGGVHPMGIGIHLDTAPPEEGSIYESYDLRSLPPQILAIEGHKNLCLKTGKRFIQNDLKQIFLKRRPFVYKTAKQEETGWPAKTSYR